MISPSALQEVQGSGLFVNTFKKKCLKGPIIFSLIQEEMKNSFFKNPPSSWGGREGGDEK